MARGSTKVNKHRHKMTRNNGMLVDDSNELTNLAGVKSLLPDNDNHSLKIKVPPMNNQNLRRSSRHRIASTGASGSEYLASEKSMEMPREPTPEPPVEFTKSRSGRRVVKLTYVESSDSEAPHPEDLFDEEHEDRPRRNSRSTRTRRALPEYDEEEPPVRRELRRSSRASGMSNFIVEDEDEKMHTQARYLTRNKSKKAAPQTNGSSKPLNQQPQQSQRLRRLTRRTAARADQEEDFYPEPQTSSGASADADGSLDDAPHTSSDVEPEPEPELELEREPEPEEEVDGRPYALRQRQKINYAIPPPLEDMAKPSKGNAGRNGGRAGGYHGHGRAGAKGRTLGWSANGAELGRWMGMPGDDSVTIFFDHFKLNTDMDSGF